MLKLNTIYKELKDIPPGRLEEIYQFVHSLNPKSKISERLKKKILSFAGIFGNMSAKEYAGFLKQTRLTRAKLFDRSFDA